MLESCISLLTLATLSLAAYGVGRSVVRGLGVAEHDTLTASVWSLAVGLIAWGSALAVLGLVGGLYRPLIVVLTLAAALWGLAEIVRGLLAASEQANTPKSLSNIGNVEVVTTSGPPNWLRRGLLILAMVTAAGSLVGALAPPTAGDALCYHLELPKRFLESGSLVYLPYHDNSTFPLLVEMEYLWAMSLDGAVAAQLMHWAMGILFALAAVVLARPILGNGWATLVGVVALLTPGVNNQMTAPMNDVALALFTTLCLAAWWRAVYSEEDSRWYVLSGLAAGGALGTKYIALVFALAMGAAWLWIFYRRAKQRRSLVVGSLVIAVFAVSVSGLWYVRAAWHRGNPVYPFLAELQSGGASSDAMATLPESKSPLGRGPAGLAIAPWQVTMRPELHGGRGHQLGVLFLATLPVLCVARRLRGLGVLLIVAGAYAVVWFLLRQNVRFLFPIVSLLSVALVWAWIEMRRFPSKALVCAAIVQAVVLSVFALNAIERSQHALAVAIGIESRDDYLARHEPTFGIASLANTLLRPGDRILSQDARLFYFNAPITQERVFRRASHYDQHVARPGDLDRELREAGFTHLLLVKTDNPDNDDFDPVLPRLVEKDPYLEAMVPCVVQDPDGAKRHYRLVKLTAPRRR